MAVGLKDIAEDLNVSVSMVSKVLSGRLGTSGASPALTQAIHNRAHELGYKRNRAAAALVSGRHGVLGVFIHRIGANGSDVADELLRGVCESAEHHSQRVWLNYYDTDEEFRSIHKHAHAGEIDGLVLAGVPHRTLLPDLLECQQRGVPVVTVHNGSDVPELVNVGSDDVELMAMATDHLLQQGCRRLGHVLAVESRYQGFCLAHRRRDIEVDPQLVYRGSYQYDAGVSAVTEWLDRGLTFDGIVAPSDQVALGALNELVRREIAVPGQVRIIGVDNSHAAQTAIVPLTSVSESYRERGQRAIDLLMDRIEGKTIGSIAMPPSLHVRESSQ